MPILKKTRNIRRTKRIYNTVGSKVSSNVGCKIGGGLMDFVIYEKQDKSTNLPFGLSEYNPSKYFESTRVNPNMYRVLYNYRTPHQIDLTVKQNQVIPSSQVVNKPHIFLADMNHYIIALIENPGTPKSRLLWLASYKNRSWERDILSYLPPTPKKGITKSIRTYSLVVYKYPNETSVDNIYKPLAATTTQRRAEFANFQTYLATNKTILALPGLTKYFKVQYDSGSALSFLSNTLGTRKTRIGHSQLAIKR
jgi:hypothetical protein